VRTEFQEVAKRPGAQPETGSKIFFVSTKQVVRAALAALKADRPLVIPGFAMKVAMFLSRLMPMPVVRLAFRLAPKRG
jgi:short-subunit dehydrogenase